MGVEGEEGVNDDSKVILHWPTLRKMVRITAFKNQGARTILPEKIMSLGVYLKTAVKC